MIGVEIEQVADEQLIRRMRDRLQLRSSSHGCPLLTGATRHARRTERPTACQNVVVQPPCGTASNEGGGLPCNAASPAATRKSSRGRPCWRQEATTVTSHRANRLPASPSASKLP